MGNDDRWKRFEYRFVYIIFLNYDPEIMIYITL